MLRLLSVLFILTMLISSEATLLVTTFDEHSQCILDINHEGDLEQESKEKEKDKTSIDELKLIADSLNEGKPQKIYFYLSESPIPAHQELNDPPPELF